MYNKMIQPCKMSVVAPDGSPSALFDHLRDNRPDTFMSDYLYLSDLSPILELEENGEVSLDSAERILDATKDLRMNSAYSNALVEALVSQGPYNIDKYGVGRYSMRDIERARREMVVADLMPGYLPSLKNLSKLIPINGPEDAIEALKAYARGEIKGPKKLVNTLQQMHDKTLRVVKRKFKGQVIEDDISILMKVDDFESAGGNTNTTGQPQDPEQYVAFMDGLNSLTTGFRRSSAEKFFKKMRGISKETEQTWKKYINTIGTDVLPKDTLEGMSLGSTTAALHSHDGNIDLYLPDRHGTVTQMQFKKSVDKQYDYIELSAYDYPKLARLNTPEKRGAFLVSSFLRQAAMQQADVALLPMEFLDPVIDMLGSTGSEVTTKDGKELIAVKLDNRFLVPPYDLGWRYKGAYIDAVFHQLASELPRDRAELIHDIITQPGFKRRHGHWDLYQKIKDGDAVSTGDLQILKTYEEGELSERVERFYQEGGTINVPKVMELLDDPLRGYSKPKQVDLSEVAWTNQYVTKKGMEEVIGRLQQSFPGLEVQIQNDPNLPYSGKFDGVVYINVANADIDTAFHEFGHAWLAALKLQNPDYYADTIANAQTLVAFTAKKKMGLNDEETAQEVLADLIGKYGEGKIKTNWLQRLMQKLGDMWYQSLGYVINPSKARVHNMVSSLVRDMTGESIIAPNLSSEMLAAVVEAALFKKVPNKLIIGEKNPLVETITGNLKAKRRTMAIKKAERILQKEYNKNKFVDGKRVIFKSDRDYNNFKKNKDDRTTFWTDLGDFNDKNTLKAKIVSLLEAQETEKRQETVKAIQEHFKQSYERRQSSTSQDRPRDVALRRLFPDFRNNLNDSALDSKIVKYAKEDLESVGLGQLYIPELDTGDIILAIHKTKRGSKYERWIDIAVLSTEHVSNKDGKETLYNKELLGRVDGIGKRGLQFTNTAYHQGALKAGLLALHLQNNGEKLHRMAVTRISKKAPGTDEDRTVLVPAGNVIPELRDLLSSEAMQAIAKQSDKANKPFLKELAFDEKFNFDEDKFKIENYYRSYIEQLVDQYDDQRREEGMEGLTGSATKDAYKASKSYLFTKNRNDIHTIINAAEARLNQLRHRKLANEDNAEFLLLSGLLQELQSPVHRGYTQIADLNLVDKYTTAVNGVTDPYLAWWIRQWKTSKINLAKELQPAIKENADQYKKLKDDFYKQNPVEGGTEIIYTAEERVFRPLIKKRTIELDGEQLEINTHRLLSEKDEEWVDLTDAQKDYINFIKERIKSTFIDWYILSKGNDAIDSYEGPIIDEEDIVLNAALNAYDNSVFKEGYLPAMRASSEEMRNRAADGGGVGAYKDSLNRWWDLQSGDVRYVDADRDLNDLPTYLLEKGLSRNSYFESLGLNEEGDPLDDIEQFKNKQKEMSDNIVDMINRFQLQQLQHKNMRHLLTSWKAARALIAHSSDEVNVVANTGNTVSANLQYLDALVQKVLFGKEISLGDDPLSRKATSILATAAAATSVVFLGFNFVANMANFTSVFTNVAVQQLAEEPKEDRPTKEEAKNTATKFLKDFQKDPNKMYSIARRVGVVHFDPYETINSRRLTGKPKSVVDMRNLYVVDQMGDEMMRMFHMYYHMQKDGVWDSWVWDAETEELTYDPSKDKRSKSIKEMVQDNMRKEIYKDPEAVNEYSPYDVNLILRLERKLSRKVGGYKEGDQTLAGMYTIGRAATQFRKYMMMHVENATKKRTVNPNSVSYRADNDNALLVPDIEEGHFTTLRKIGSRLRDIEHLSLEEIKDVIQDPIEMENIRKMMLYTFVSALATMGYMLFAAEDDEEINKIMGKSNKWEGFWTRMYHAIQGEMNMLNMLQSKSLVFTNPLTFTALITLAAKLTEDLTSGDYEKFGDDIAKKVGAVKIIAEASADE